MEVKGQRALVTGGASGLGLACVRALKEAGAEVIVWDRQLPEQTEANVSYYACDVANAAQVQQTFDDMYKSHGAPRILIQCAGVIGAGRMVGKQGPMPVESFEQVIRINLVGSFHIMSLVSEKMMTLPEIGEERGVILNTASVAAYEGQIGQMAYSASKGAIVSMTLPAARELGKHHIRVNTIAPGLMETPMLGGLSEELQDRLKQTFVFPERLGKPSEFAKLALSLVENPLMNGGVIRLDGAIRLTPR